MLISSLESRCSPDSYFPPLIEELPPSLQPSQTLNSYRYSFNDPINRIDPSGHGAPSKAIKAIEKLILKGGKELTIKEIKKIATEKAIKHLIEHHHMVTQKLFEHAELKPWFKKLGIEKDKAINIALQPNREGAREGIKGSLHVGRTGKEYLAEVEKKLLAIKKRNESKIPKEKISDAEAIRQVEEYQNELRELLRKGELKINNAEIEKDPALALGLGLALNGMDQKEIEGIIEQNVEDSIGTATEEIAKGLADNRGKYLRVSHYTGEEGFMGWVGWTIDWVNPGDDIATAGDLLIIAVFAGEETIEILQAGIDEPAANKKHLGEVQVNSADPVARNIAEENKRMSRDPFR